MSLFSMRRIVTAGGALAAVALLVLLFRPTPVPVDLAPAERGTLQVTVDEEGQTRVRQRFLIAAPVAGRLQRIALDEGDAVDVGAVVARMNPLPLDPRSRAEASARLEAAEAAQREAEARVAHARAALDQARRDAERARALRAAGTISQEERERAELQETTQAKQLEAALFAAQAAEHNVRAARAALLAPGATTTVTVCAEEPEACIELRSPVRGQILRVLEENERVVPIGAPLLEIADPSALEIVVDVLSAAAVAVQPGQPALIEEWGGDPLRGRVRLVEPSGFTKISALGVEEQRVNVIVDFDGHAPSLGDGFRVETRIIVSEVTEALKVPGSALFRSDGEWTVFRVAGGRARRTAVVIGARNAVEVEIRRGLEEGDVVVLHPSDRLADGVRVEPGA